jgi:hypothetical protein
MPLAATARAAVTLDLSGCRSLSEAALGEHLALELSTLGLDGVRAQLRLRCAGSLVTAELTRPLGDPSPIETRVELRDTAKSERERLVALAVSELIAQAERAAAGAPSVAPALERHEPERARELAPGESARRHELSLAALTSFEGSEPTALWGGALGARFSFARWSLLLDTRFERGTAALALSDVRWSSLTGFAGVGLSAGSSALELRAGLGVRAGWLALDAKPRAPHEGLSLTAPWAGVALPIGVVTRVGGRVRPFFGLEGGYVFLPDLARDLV